MGHKAATEGFSWGIWGFAFGYFAFYIPYSALAKSLSLGLLPSMEGVPIAGFSLLPASVMMSAIGMVIFITVMRWWKYATHSTVFGLNLPRPTGVTFTSGLCTGVIIGTTTLAYTFEGISIVFVMLLMRGGVLIIAPIVDSLTGRTTHWYSWAGLALSMAALVIAFSERGGYAITVVCIIDIAAYLSSYFFRLRFMSRKAKSDDPNTTKRYFVEEQMTAAPSLLVMLGIGALIGGAEVLEQLRWGFTEIWNQTVLFEVLLIGFLSQGTGICGSLIFLDKRENTYCVPVNRCSSILAGVLASYSLHLFLNQSAPSPHKLAGAGCIVTAILFLTIPPMIAKARAKSRLAAAASA